MSESIVQDKKQGFYCLKKGGPCECRGKCDCHHLTVLSPPPPFDESATANTPSKNDLLGFSLVELLVVITIIGILASLLLPAVQAAREASHRMACANNLRQLGIALQNYHSQHNCFPGLGASSMTGFSIQARLLPYVEQANLQQLIDFTQPLYLGDNHNQALNPLQAVAAKARISLFRCLSDACEDTYEEDGGILAGGNYVVCGGSGVGTTYDLRYPTDGMFFYGSACGIHDIKDGSSHTLVFSESILGARTEAAVQSTIPTGFDRLMGFSGHTPNSTSAGLSGLTNPSLASLAKRCQLWYGNRCFGWITGKPHATAFIAYATPNDSTPDVFSMGIGFYAARSFHPGGVNAGFADGSVHFISDETSVTVWRALATRAGGETTDNF